MRSFLVSRIPHIIYGVRIFESTSKPLRLYCDNSTAVLIAKNNKSGSQRKHIDIKYLAERERVKDKKVVIEYVSTDVLLDNPLTKGMPPQKFKDHVVTTGLRPTMENLVVTINVVPNSTI